MFDTCVTGVETDDNTPYGICIGFVWGDADMDHDFKACISDRLIRGREMREVVTNYIKAHPEHRGLPGVLQVRLALFAAFCPDTELTIGAREMIPPQP